MASKTIVSETREIIDPLTTRVLSLEEKNKETEKISGIDEDELYVFRYKFKVNEQYNRKNNIINWYSNVQRRKFKRNYFQFILKTRSSRTILWCSRVSPPSSKERNTWCYNQVCTLRNKMKNYKGVSEETANHRRYMHKECGKWRRTGCWSNLLQSSHPTKYSLSISFYKPRATKNKN